MDMSDRLSTIVVEPNSLAALTAENQVLRAEIRVAHEAAEITARMVVEEFEKADRLMSELQDTTQEVQRFNDELSNANQKLSELDRLKSDFLSSVSHELRTPLTSIRGFAKLVGRDLEAILSKLDIKDTKLLARAERINGNLTIIQEEGERLTRLINDVLDLAKIESGRIDWKMEVCDIAKLVEQAVAASTGQFADKQDVELMIDMDVGLPYVNVDRDRMVQVVINLLNNAAKFTHKGFVRIMAAPDADGGVLLTVQDTGEGFSSEDAEIIFDKFRQVIHGDTLHDKPKGTGLGLAICREIVEQFGGRIWAESQPGAGTVMSILLPASAKTMLQVPVPAETPERFETEVLGVKAERAAMPSLSIGPTSLERLMPLILVVDDDENVCGYLAQLLNQEGYQTISAANGRQALALAAAKRPDLVTMDIAMPVMDGDTAIAQFRRDPQLRNIPVVVVSALPSRDKSAGDAVLGKPVDETELLDTIRSLLNLHQFETIPPPREIAVPCLVLCPDELPKKMPPYIRTGHAEFCTLSDFMRRVNEGFEGVVVIPTGMLRHVDFSRLEKNKSLQLLVMPDEASEEKQPLPEVTS
ncbi:MAG: ATP-binding protein [Rhodospirillales bacterium]|nr:ATP-binding protein [Rhodospirillales bacterium]